MSDRIHALDQEIAGLEGRLLQIRQEFEGAEREHRASLYREQESIQKARAAHEAAVLAALEKRKPFWAQDEASWRAFHRRRAARVERAYARCQAQVREALRLDTEQDEENLGAARELILESDRLKTEEVSVRREVLAGRIAALRDGAGALNQDLERLARACSLRLEPPEHAAPLEALAAACAPDPALDELTAHLVASTQAFEKLRRSRWTILARRRFLWGAGAALVAAHGAAFLLRQPLGLDHVSHLLGLGLSLVFSLLFLHLLASAAGRRVAGAIGRLYHGVYAAFDRLDGLSQGVRAWVEQSAQTQLETRIARILATEEQIVPRLEERKRAATRELGALQARFNGLRARIVRAQDEDLKARRAARAAETAGENARQESERLAREAAHASVLKAAGARLAGRQAQLESEWKERLTLFVDRGRASCEDLRTRHAAWAELAARPPVLPAEFPAEIPVATLRLPLEKLKTGETEEPPLWPDGRTVELPLALTFPERGHLFVAAPGARRDEALSVLFNTVLRLLLSFPPGKAKFTLVDPAGLGKTFSGLLPLADLDESLVGARIWTETVHIEQRLTELTEHIEKVIQKYLRNRYRTIADYNRETGVLQEAYRFLVVADFPSGFSELALERLAGIVNSGAPCGVHVLLAHDSRLKLPAALDAARLHREALVLNAGPGAGAWTARHGRLELGSASVEALPPNEALPPLLEAIGAQARQAARVELDFGLAAPRPEQVWSRSAQESFRVPIGRSGADRLQELELGRGTAQHALIAGRTGSGKSTLFHVAITNAALWYGPEEVEFYLIDFKKGVEFKTYATHRLPHARVVAVESDREFGLSVLRRIDEELTRRGELFRAAGVQDLAAFRARRPGVILPRTLLLIDEFQEFFTEDDAISRDASLFLDRFVRQGRAFGMHALLGSQTLSGVYTLAKSTLGQMGVRIALQCNEADSYLILSEDNAAARLLSRPGEAIYNDQSGLVEGNNPFQVVWLPEADQSARLRLLAERAERERRRPAAATVVFEGNAPADLEHSGVLAPLFAAGSPAPAAVRRIWLGEPNAIKGPTEVHFGPEAGSSLLIVGQRRDTAFGLTCASLLSLAAAHPPREPRMLVLNGLVSDLETARRLERLAEVVPHKAEVVPYRGVAKAIEDLDRLIAARQEGETTDHGPVFLFVFGLHRLRALRQEDEYAPSRREEGPPTGERFANILRSGPEQNVHSVLWCDTLNNFQRALGRQMLREFDQRVLFQMSAADSSELVDSPAANQLGMHNALLAVESAGVLEKFRPFAFPEEACLERVGQALRARAAAAL